MTYKTDERLKGYLDTNQLQRERMCLAILMLCGVVRLIDESNRTVGLLFAVKDRFDIPTTVRPAPGVTGANIRKPLVQRITATEKEGLIKAAKDKGMADCDVMDRERMRLVLDGADGLAVRFQALGIPMSEAEQATFFARWGDDIQSVIAEGFSEIKRSLNRMQFLQEMNAPLEQFLVLLELDREYDGAEIGHFRFFVSLSLTEPRYGLFMVTFGASDRADRANANFVSDVEAMPAGILQRMMGAKWEGRIPTTEEDEKDGSPPLDNAEDIKGTQVGTFTLIGMKQVRFLRAEFGYGGGLFRFGPYLRLSDLDGSMIALFVNKTLAEKVKAIHLIANHYKLAEYGRDGFRVDTQGKFEPRLIFTPAELSDEWRRIMRNFGPFRVNFSEITPVRIFEPAEASNSLQRSKDK